ncbi:MAG: DNA polymerase III subunit beta [Treponema sp.]|nr:DNA polymerase III subunit beta [Treponema sp.]
MKFVFDRDAMIKEIAIAQEVITNKSPLSILSNVLLIAENGELVIKATDSTVRFTTSVPVDIEEEGRTTVFCDKFMSILSSLPSGDVEFKQDELYSVTIKPINKKVKFQLKTQASDKFPEIGSSENVPFFEIAARDFKEMIKQTIFAVSHEIRNKTFMTGAYFIKKDDVLTMVATDGRRLSCVTKDALGVPDFPPAIIPTKVLASVLKNVSDEGNIQLSVIDKSIFIKFANVEFSSNLIEGQFPNYEKVIPQNLTTSFQVNKSDLESALKRTSIMADKEINKIMFKITSGVLSIVSPETANGAAEEEIPCRYDGKDISMALNFIYVSEPLKVIDAENIVFNFNVDETFADNLVVTKAIIVKPETSSDYLHVIMPLK